MQSDEWEGRVEWLCLYDSLTLTLLELLRKTTNISAMVEFSRPKFKPSRLEY